ncbi:MAG: glycosyltransferase family 39 protein [Pseudomonadota bacterium]
MRLPSIFSRRDVVVENAGQKAMPTLKPTPTPLSCLSTRFFWSVLCVLLLARAGLAALLPMTGDEAYFVLWGERLAAGYYDHPPMVGWWLHALLHFSRAEWVLRLPALLLPLLLAAVAYWLLLRQGVLRARAAALLILLAPVNVWNVLITTDTPVLLFSLLSALAYLSAQTAKRQAVYLLGYALAGAFLGLAFLGKYFAALLGIAYLVHTLRVRGVRGVGALMLLLLVALPAPLFNLWWNSAHCWDNILFNFVNRQQAVVPSWRNPVFYALAMFYLLTPWLLSALWRARQRVRAALSEQLEVRSLLYLAALPLGFLALLSCFRPVGLHWPVAFIPFVLLLAAYVLPLPQLDRVLRYSAFFALAHWALIVALALTPVQTWRHSAQYDSIVLTTDTQGLLAALAPYAQNYVLASEGYSPAAILAFHAQKPVPVFGEGSLHARQDDSFSDWRAFDGGNILILKKGSNSPDALSSAYADYFSRIEFRQLEFAGAQYSLVLGQGYRYEDYREQVLRRIRARFYRIPAWLPQRRDCPFTARYFPDELAHAN